MVSLTLWYFVQSSSWLTSRVAAAQVHWVYNKPKWSAVNAVFDDLVWGLCAKRGAVRDGQVHVGLICPKDMAPGVLWCVQT